MSKESAGHTPVLPGPVQELLGPAPGETVADVTVGLGGHALMLAEKLGPTGMLVGLDVDPGNLEIAEEALAGCDCKVRLVRSNFTALPKVLQSLDIVGVDVLLADLGVSSTQLDVAERGFSFQRDGPLDMRMDPELKVTATDLVNSLKDRELADILYYNAQETASRRIAKRICEHRREHRITTTTQLAQIVAGAVRVDPTSRKSRIHPATRTFQALRIAVNHEIDNLQTLLDLAPGILKPGGRFGVIAFHSIEDKPVKLDFRKRKTERVYRIVTKKPLIADEDERRTNPRSRSAKLRVAVRLPEPAASDDAES